MDGKESPRGKKLHKRRLESKFFAGSSKQSSSSIFNFRKKSSYSQLQSKGSEKGEFSGTNSDKELVCCSLPKSKLLVKTETAKESDYAAKNEGQLPPPNTKYFMSKPMSPLKFTRPYNFSGFVLEDNSVVLVGTKKYEETLQHSFLNYLEGGMEDVDDFVAKHFKKDCYEKSVEETAVEELVKKDAEYAALQFKPQYNVTTFDTTSSITTTISNITATSTIATNAASTAISTSDHAIDVEGIIFDDENREPSHSVGAGPSVEIIKVEEGISKKHETDFELHEKGHHEDWQPADYYYFTSSSDEEEDLPRVQVTGRSRSPVRRRHKLADTGSDCGGSNKECIISDENEIGISQATLSVTEGADGARDSSLQTGLPEECPVCGIVFPVGISLCEADEHIANCLSISINDLED